MPRLFLAIIVLMPLSNANAQPVNETDLRPGLAATFRDSGKGEVVQLEPTIGLALKAGEAAHPRLSADGGSVRWEGFVNVLRAGNYRFSATLRGKFTLRIGDKEVLAAETKGENASRVEGPETRLAAGIQPLVAEFTRLPGAARVELFWQSPNIHLEPLPFDQLGHLPKQTPERLKTDAQIERGRFLAEEHNCLGCHRPADEDKLAKGLIGRQGPDLSQIGQRAHAGWIYQWLEAPDKLRPGAAMPRMLSESTERHAVAQYLASLGGPLQPNPKQPDSKVLQESIDRGRRLFASVGCVACHTHPEASGGRQTPADAPASGGLMPSARRWSLTGLGSKTTPEKLAAFLQNPLAIDPSGRMPHMLLHPKEADDLAQYLCSFVNKDAPVALPPAPKQTELIAAFQRVDARADELAAFQKLPPAAQLIDLGKRLVIEKGCNNCHTIAPGGQPFANMLADASFDDLKKPEKHAHGCLASDDKKRAKAPAFAFDDNSRKSLALFLSEGTKGAGSSAPAHAARAALARFNCLACHQRDGEGGISPDLAEELRKYEKAENAEAVVPPPLTGTGHKLRTPWLRQVLTQAGRARPWMGLRMPQFGADNIGKLPEGLAALEGTEPDDQVHQVPVTVAKVEAGRQLAGKSAFGCVSCHDIAGIPNTGTRGPDLAGMNQRVRYDWYRRWLEQPQRMQPGTRMPSVFTEGKSLLDKVLGGTADAQAEAMWAYFSLGPSLPLPEGMGPPKGITLAVKDRPIVVRTFMPEAGAKALAVGYPGGVSTVFDAATCRLVYAWAGNYLDVSPVWDGRGGNPAKVLGTRFWTASAGCPWEVTDSAQPPDFAARAKDPAYGGALPEGKLLNGPRQLRFEGFSHDPQGQPTFRYLLYAATKQPLEITERPEPLRATAGVGVARHFTVSTPSGQTAWLLAGEAKREPRALTDNGVSLPLDLKPDTVEVSANARLLVLPQEGERVLALTVTAAPEGSRWVLRRQGATWQAMLRLPVAKEAIKQAVSLRVWAPNRDEPGLLKDLLSLK